MMQRIAIVLAIAAGALILTTGRASAHLYQETGSGLLWYVDGVTYDTKTGEVKDPINFVFMGGPADTSDYTRERIETHLNDDWDTDAVGGSGWRTNGEIFGPCKDDQIVKWLNYPGVLEEKTDWHGSTSTKRLCKNQMHARFWDDSDHARNTAGHGRLHQWAIGGVHHEKVKPHFPCCFGHKINRDWDVVRREVVKGMRAHCSEVSWRYMNTAAGDADRFQGYDNLGFVARISLHHFSDGGCAGQ
jgi:hypothetical protein